MTLGLTAGQAVMLATVGWLVVVAVGVALGLRLTGWFQGGASS